MLGVGAEAVLSTRAAPQNICRSSSASAADGKTLLNPFDVLSQVLVADMRDPAGDRVWVVAQFFGLIIGGESLQIVLRQRRDDRNESFVRASQVDQHLG